MARKKFIITSNFPVRGLDESRAYGDQQPETCVDLQNVRAFSVADGRLRGGQRPGLGDWVGGLTGTEHTIEPDDVAHAHPVDEVDIVNLTNGLSDNLLAYWKYEELTGNVNDEQGTKDLIPYSGTIGSDASGKNGNSRQILQANSEVFSVASSAPFRTTGSFTFSTWVKPLVITGTARIIAGVWEPAVGMSWNASLLYRSVSQRWECYFNRRNTSEHTVSLSLSEENLGTGEWHHVLVWRDDSANIDGLAYNGVETEISSVGILDGSPAQFIIGGSLSGALVNTTLQASYDETGYWTVALTPVQRALLWNNGAGTFYDTFL